MGRQRGGGNEKDTTKRSLWVLRNNAPVAVQVETGATDGQFTAIKSGDISPDDQVITDATQRSG
jgi:HlyD family secretion protein